MLNTSFKLPNGTEVTAKGTVEEVSKLLDFYSDSGAGEKPPQRKPTKTQSGSSGKVKTDKEVPDLAEIVNAVKNCDEAEAIETQILDRTSIVNRAILPLYIVHQQMANRFGLTTGEVSKITTNLGVPIATSNVSRTLSGSAKSYVIGDKIRKKGQPVRYKISRRGLKYLKSVIEESKGEH